MNGLLMRLLREWLPALSRLCSRKGIHCLLFQLLGLTTVEAGEAEKTIAKGWLPPVRGLESGEVLLDRTLLYQPGL